jgi:hypothetical protein
LSPAFIDNDCPFTSALVCFFCNTETRPLVTRTSLPSSKLSSRNPARPSASTVKSPPVTLK